MPTISSPRPYKRNIFQRLLGICATPMPRDGDCWSYQDGRFILDLARAPELERPGGSLRLEGKNCPERILVIYGDDMQYHAYRNRCEHKGRRLDPIPGEDKIQCCSVGKATYDYEGKIMAGPAEGALTAYRVEMNGGKLVVTIIP